MQHLHDDVHCHRKKFVIEKLDGTKIVSRSRGFTTRTCVKVASNSQTDPSGKIIAPSVSVLLIRHLWPACHHILPVDEI